MTPHSPGHEPPTTGWFVDLLYGGLLAITVFAGKLGLGRLAPALGAGYLTEIRLWALLGAVLLAWRARHRLRDIGRALPLAVSLVALCAYLALRGLAGHGPGYEADLVDMAFILAQCALVCMSTRRQLLVVGAGAIALALLMFILAVAGVGDEALNGDGWGPIGGPTTFYRIEFLAACLCWAALHRPGWQRWILAGLAGVFLFGTVASLSKIALPGAVLVLAGLTLQALWRRDLPRAAWIVGTTVLSVALWQATMAEAMHNRVARALDTVGEHEPVQKHLLNPERKSPQHVSIPGSRATLRIGTDFHILTQYCVSRPKAEAAGAPVDTVCTQGELFDRSSRLLFAAVALTDLAASPVWGLGPDRFRMQMPNLKTGEIETYTYPHNLVLEVAHAGGLVGALLLLVALGLVARALLQSGLRHPAVAALAGAALFLLLSALVSGDFYDSRLIWLIGFAMPVLWPAPSTSPQRDPSPR